MLVRMNLDPARERYIYGFFERYFTLTNEEEEILMQEIKKLDEAEKIMELPISYEERGIEKGKEIGIRQVALEMLKEGVSEEFIAKVTHLEKEEIEKLKKGY